jgi:hypothetical protein
MRTHDFGQPDDEDLEDNFPLGDGTVDTFARVQCPYCWQKVEIAIDPGSGDSQQYEEDCEVCCRPWLVSVYYDGSGAAHVQVSAAEE